MSKKKRPRKRPSQLQARGGKQGRSWPSWLLPAGGVLVVATVVAIVLLRQPSEKDGKMGSLSSLAPEQRNRYFSSPPEMTLDLNHDYRAVIVTEKGNITVDLYEQRTPNTVNNFVSLARQGFYDGVTFHRVLDGFMAQAGDPTGRGSGGPGYTFADEALSEAKFDRAGLLAMANAGPNTNGSQFFITFVPTPHLNGRHTIFGEVIEGFDVLENLTRRDPQANPTFAGDKILRIDILESQ
jgi:cyclophilin family peptidyl-prolyl cis-trans isomerase